MENFLLGKNDISILLQSLQAMMASAGSLTRGKVKHPSQGSSERDVLYISISIYFVLLVPI